ncbi:protein phosphatase 2C domain-containing protein [Streptomyces sp. NPDC053755]|uniref:protein phosphatase 2C domain-containing protein n=1 Tax=Streptomyces sp. NPDC053755 TaxID=3155815 RepID=UPI003448A373
MTQQGDHWWDKLYDESVPDTAPTTTGDTLDDRFDSASRAMPASVRRDAVPFRPEKAPWEPLDADAGVPRTFPSAPCVPDPPDDPERPPAAPARPADAPTVQVPAPRPRTEHIGSRPPTYEPEPTALPVARPGELADLVADTVLDGARYGAWTLRAASVRGDSARYRGEPRRDTLLTARFGQDEAALVLVAVAGGPRAAGGSHRAAADACRWIGEAVGRSHTRLSEDIRAGRRGDLKSGLHRLTDRTYGRLRARAAELGLDAEDYTASLRCLLLSADPDCRTRVFFGIGRGGLFRLRDGSWQDIEPFVPEPATLTGAPVVGFGSPPAPARAADDRTPADEPSRPAAVSSDPLGPAPAETEEGDRLTMNLGVTGVPRPFVEDPAAASARGSGDAASPAPPAEPFRFRASVARPGDTLLLASSGLADAMRGEPALAEELAARWAVPEAPGLAAFLADTQLRVKGYADDRTAAAVWEA